MWVPSLVGALRRFSRSGKEGGSYLLLCSRRPLVRTRLTSENHRMGMSELSLIVVFIVVLVTSVVMIYAVIRLIFTMVRYLDRRR